MKLEGTGRDWHFPVMRDRKSFPHWDQGPALQMLKKARIVVFLLHFTWRDDRFTSSFLTSISLERPCGETPFTSLLSSVVSPIPEKS